jgi:hypothetical protein
MSQFTVTTMSNLSRTGVAFLLLSLGTASPSRTRPGARPT